MIITCTGTVMFQLRRRADRPTSSLRKSGSVDDVKVPRILPATAQSPGMLTINSCFSDLVMRMAAHFTADRL